MTGIGRDGFVRALPGLTLLLLCVLRPLEIHPEAAAAAAFLVFLCALLLPRRAAASHAAVAAALVAYLVPFLVLNLAMSVDPHAGLLVAARWALLAVLGAQLALFAARGGTLVLARLAALIGSSAALLAVWQGLFGFARQAAEIASAIPPGQGPLRAAALARLSSGRVFGPFPLPASLGGALAITLPLTLALISPRTDVRKGIARPGDAGEPGHPRRGRGAVSGANGGAHRSPGDVALPGPAEPRSARPADATGTAVAPAPWIPRKGARMLCGAAAVLQGAAFVWTFSLGALASLAGASLLVLAPRLLRSARGRKLLAGALGAGILLAASVLLARRCVLPQPGPEDRPLHYRVGNWAVALSMLADHPLAGTGLGTFGTAFPAYRKEGMNESRYAHCTWLQLPAEMGIGCAPLLVLAAFGGFLVWRRGRNSGPLVTAASIGTLTFLLHNLVDFTFYQPSVGALFVLAAVLAAGENREGMQQTLASGYHPAGPASMRPAGMKDAARGADLRLPERAGGSWLYLLSAPSDAALFDRGGPCWAAAVSVCAAAGVMLGFAAASDLAIERARAAHGRNPEHERRMLVLAGRLDPLDADPRGTLASVLAGPAGATLAPPQDRARALAEARAAVALDPRTPFRRRDLAWILAGSGHPAAAWIAMAQAEALYPLKAEYRRDVEALQGQLFGVSAEPSRGEARR